MSYMYEPPETFLEMYDTLGYVAYAGRARRPEVGSRNKGHKQGPKGLAKNQRAADYLEKVDDRLYVIKYRILEFLMPNDPNLSDLENILKAYEQAKGNRA